MSLLPSVMQHCLLKLLKFLNLNLITNKKEIFISFDCVWERLALQHGNIEKSSTKYGLLFKHFVLFYQKIRLPLFSFPKMLQQQSFPVMAPFLYFFDISTNKHFPWSLEQNCPDLCNKNFSTLSNFQLPRSDFSGKWCKQLRSQKTQFFQTWSRAVLCTTEQLCTSNPQKSPPCKWRCTKDSHHRWNSWWWTEGGDRARLPQWKQKRQRGHTTLSTWLNALSIAQELCPLG